MLPVPSSKEVVVGSVRWPVNECVHIIMHHTVQQTPERHSQYPVLSPPLLSTTSILPLMEA